LTSLVAIAQLTKLPLRYFAGVGELDDYPAIDWFATEQEESAAIVERVLLHIGSVDGPQRQLVLSQLQALVQALQC
jgi:hypothetical protein